MHRAKLDEINNHLYRLKNDLSRISKLNGKGCTVDYSLSELYSRFKDTGEVLKEALSDKGLAAANDDLHEMSRRYKELLAEFNTVTDNLKLNDKGMVLASDRAIPEFFYKITGRYKNLWKVFEYMTFISGVGIIAFTLFIVTYYSAFGFLPLIHVFDNTSSAIKVAGFTAGLAIGLFIHEFAHGIILANNGIKIKQAGLMAGSMVGGFIEADEDTFFQADSRVQLRFNAASIGTNALSALLIAIPAFLANSVFIFYFALGDLFFGIINSFPIRPLDGGWVYEDVIKIYVKNKTLQKILMSARYLVVVSWVVLFIFLVLRNS